jgi:hypothetical protein
MEPFLVMALSTDLSMVASRSTKGKSARLTSLNVGGLGISGAAAVTSFPLIPV